MPRRATESGGEPPHSKGAAIMSRDNTICWVDIPVRDLDRAIGFYSAILGKEVKKETAPGFAFGLLPHEDHNVSGTLSVMTNNGPSESGPLVYLSVDGRLEAAVAAARAQGAKILEERTSLGPHGIRAVLIDSEGNRIALHTMAS